MSDNQSAVVQIFKDVKAYLAVEAPDVEVVFGIRARWDQLNQGAGGGNRVVVIPGALDGADGSLDGAPGPTDVPTFDGGVAITGAKPRTLYSQSKIVTFSIWSPLDAGDDAERQEFVEDIHEKVFLAVAHSAAGGANARWTSERYNRNPAELRAGDEYIAALELETSIFDATPKPVVPTAARVSRGTLA